MMIMPAMTSEAGTVSSQLQNWLIQLHLAPESNPAYQGASLLISADCAGFAGGNLHRDFIAGRMTIIGCPKLDEVQVYVKKLSRMFAGNDIKDVTILRMEVHCCGGLPRMVKEAIKRSGKELPVQDFIVKRFGGEAIEAGA